MLMTVPDLVSQVAKNVNCISAAEAKQLLNEQHGLLIDVREPAEHSSKSASGAVNIPRGLLEMKLPELEKDENRAIFVHCAAGGRATLAAEQLQRIGYRNVYAIRCKADDVCATFCD
jgi:phage shock protein E